MPERGITRKCKANVYLCDGEGQYDWEEQCSMVKQPHIMVYFEYATNEPGVIDSPLGEGMSRIGYERCTAQVQTEVEASTASESHESDKPNTQIQAQKRGEGPRYGR